MTSCHSEGAERPKNLFDFLDDPFQPHVILQFFRKTLRRAELIRHNRNPNRKFKLNLSLRFKPKPNPKFSPRFSLRLNPNLKLNLNLSLKKLSPQSLNLKSPNLKVLPHNNPFRIPVPVAVEAPSPSLRV